MFNYLIGRSETSLICSNTVNQFIALRFPRRWLSSRRIKLVIEQTESLFAGKCSAWKEGAIPHREFDFYVDPVGFPPLYEWRPKPVVDVVVGHVADDIRPPVDALLKVGEAFFHPL